MLTQSQLQERLHYDPETGNFTYLKSSGGNSIAGTTAGHLKEGYIRIKILGTSYYAQRLVWLYMYGEFYHHS